MERESAEVIAEARVKAEQQANEIIAAAKQSAKQIIFQAFQRSLSNLVEKDRSAQESVEGVEDGEREHVATD
jgi:F0F1-type ATP synthase membrane subunit b/b'